MREGSGSSARGRVELYQREKAETRAEGLREGLALLRRLCQRKLGRDLTTPDGEILVARLAIVGADRLGDIVLDLDGYALDRWLHDPDAR